MIAHLLSSVIGLILLITALIKVNESRSFVTHIMKLELFPHKISYYFAFFITGFEAALGIGLLLNSYPEYLLPLAIAQFLFFAVLTYWGTSTGKVDDCGCYGGLLAIEPSTSILLDFVYAAILVVSYLLLPEVVITSLWQWIVPLAILPVAAYFAYGSFKEAYFDLSRLKAGKKWNANWISGVDTSEGEFFIVFFGKDCPYCKRWVPLMNVMNTQRDLPKVIGLMNLSEEEIHAFKENHLVRFEVLNIRKALWNTMINAVPTAVKLRDGVIEDKWEGQLPEEYAKRIQSFLQAIAESNKSKGNSAFAG